MNLSMRIRQTHRWLGVIFTLTVFANFAWMAFGTPPPFIVYSPLIPLFILMFSGLYMIARDYAWKRQT
jgi:hypothetical protein